MQFYLQYSIDECFGSVISVEKLGECKTIEDIMKSASRINFENLMESSIFLEKSFKGYKFIVSGATSGIGYESVRLLKFGGLI